MAEKTLKTRIVQKHATQAEWDKSTLVPKAGEVIVYDKDSTHSSARVKIGDGSTMAKNLPFITDESQALATSAKDTATAAAQTTGATDTSDKIFLVGAKSQGEGGQETYSHDTVYVDANGALTTQSPLNIIGNTTPGFNIRNASNTLLSTFYNNTTNGEYSQVVLAVASDATNRSRFLFGANGDLTIPGTIFSQSFRVYKDSFPQIELGNSNKNPLSLWYVNTSTGGYSNTTLRVHSSASAYKEFVFKNDGTFASPSLALGSALSIAYGGTGATSAASARTNLDVPSTTLIKSTMRAITVEGDKDHYYPVLISCNSTFYINRIAITRGYNETAPDDWGEDASHKGGLTFQFQWNGDSSWGGNGTTNTLKVEALQETYCKMVGGLALSTLGVIVWLRGGTAKYYILNEMGYALTATPYYTTYTDQASKTFEVRTYDASKVASEITARQLMHNYLPLSGGTLTGALTLKSTVAIRNNTQYTSIHFAPNFATDTRLPGIIYFDAGNTTSYGANGVRFQFRQFSPSASGATTSSSYFEDFYLPRTEVGKTVNGNYTIFTTKNPPSAAQVGALALSGGTLTGTLTVNKELYSNAAVISKRNSCPQFIMQNANGAQLGSIYSTTSDGSYGNIAIIVNKDSSSAVYYNFSNSGRFSSPIDVQTPSFRAKSKTNPNLSFLNSSEATLAQLYVATTDDSYGNVLLKVQSSASAASTFTFYKDGSFNAPSNIHSKGTLVSQTNSFPGLTIQNNSGANLAKLYSNGTSGGYSNVVLRVYSSSSAYSSYSFGNDGTLDFGGVLRSGSHTIKGNSYPALSFTDLSVNKTFAYLQPQTSAGDYADLCLVVKNSSGQSTFQFAMNGDLTVPRKLYAGLGQSVKSFTAGSGKTGYIKFATIKISANYQNQPIRMAIAQREKYGDFKLCFINVKNTDPTIKTFVSTGSIVVYAHKSATSAWDLYIGKSEAYDQVDITVFENGTYNSFSLTWTDVFAATLPSGAIAATAETWNGAAASANALNNTLAISKGGTGATTASGALTNLGALPLTGGTLTGALTAKALYASDGNVTGSHLVTQTNNYPEVYFKNAAGATLADFYVNTTSGEYADTILKVFSDASTAKYFMFGKNGTFYIPNSFSTVMGEIKSNAWPQLFFRNANGNNLAQFVIPTDNGSYRGLAVNVFSDASTNVQYTFNSDGTFIAPKGITTTGNYISIKNNSYPQLTFSNASGTDLGKIFVSTANGSYAGTKIRAYSSASSSYDFQFVGDGTFNCATLIPTNALGIAYGGTGATSAASARTALGITPANIGAAASSHTHSYLSLSGGTITGSLTVSGNITSNGHSVYTAGGNIIYSSSQPTGSTGMIWLKPV